MLLFSVIAGQYECYWHFHHKGLRFGHWLGCQVIVDAFNLKGNKSVLDTSFSMPFEQSPESQHPFNYAVKYSVPEIGKKCLMIIKTLCFVSFNHVIWNIFIKGASPNNQDKYGKLENQTDMPDRNLDGSQDFFNTLVRNISRQVEDIKLQDPTDTNCSSDSDNQSIGSLNDGSFTKLTDEFVVVSILYMCVPNFYLFSHINNYLQMLCWYKDFIFD